MSVISYFEGMYIFTSRISLLGRSNLCCVIIIDLLFSYEAFFFVAVSSSCICGEYVGIMSPWIQVDCHHLPTQVHDCF